MKADIVAAYGMLCAVRDFLVKLEPPNDTPEGQLLSDLRLVVDDFEQGKWPLGITDDSERARIRGMQHVLADGEVPIVIEQAKEIYKEIYSEGVLAGQEMGRKMGLIDAMQFLSSRKNCDQAFVELSRHYTAQMGPLTKG